MKRKKNGAAPRRETGRQSTNLDSSIACVQGPVGATTDIRVKPLG